MDIQVDNEIEKLSEGARKVLFKYGKKRGSSGNFEEIVKEQSYKLFLAIRNEKTFGPKAQEAYNTIAEIWDGYVESLTLEAQDRSRKLAEVTEGNI